MKSKLAALLIATTTLGVAPAIFAPATAHAEVEASFEFFYDSLQPYGDWIEVGDYGACWRPKDVDENWSPYTDGYWSYTDGGWTWVSYEDFGGIVYHYGRWVRVEDEGWCWVPDYEWGPAWVSWRNSDEYVGWAPLPPEAHWQPDVGFSVWVDTSYDIGPSNYSFCAVRDFGAPVIREVILPRPRNIVIIENTVNITNITINRQVGIPFCGGPRFDFFAGRVARPIPTLKLVQQTNVVNNFYNNKTVINNTVINNKTVNRRSLQAVVQGNQLIVPAPHLRRPTGNPLASVPNFKPTKVVGAGKINHGWNQMKDMGQREQLREKIAQQTKGLKPESAPARPIQTAELQPVPVKADPDAPSPVTGGKNRRPGKPGQDGPAAPNNIAVGEPDPTAGGRGNGQGGGPGRQKEKGNRPDVATQLDDAQSNPGASGRATPDEPKRDKKHGVPTIAGETPLKPFNPGGVADGNGPGGKRGKGAANARPDGTPGNPDAPQGVIPGVPDAQAESGQGMRNSGVEKDAPERQGNGNGRKQREQAQRTAEAQGEDNAQARGQQEAQRAQRREAAQAAEAAQATAAENKRQRAEAAQQEMQQQRRAQAQAEATQQRAAQAAKAERAAQAGNENRREQAEAAQQQMQQQRRMQAQQAEVAQRRAQQQQNEVMEQRRQQAAAAAQANEGRRQQAEAMRQQQALRQQQMQAQAERAQQMQRQMQQQQQFRQAPPQAAPQAVPQGGGGQGHGGGHGKRGMTKEEAAALQGR